MGMRIDKTGGDHAVTGIDYLIGQAVDVAYPDDLAIGYRDITVESRRAGAINEGSILNQNIIGHLMLRAAAFNL